MEHGHFSCFRWDSVNSSFSSGPRSISHLWWNTVISNVSGGIVSIQVFLVEQSHSNLLSGTRKFLMFKVGQSPLKRFWWNTVILKFEVEQGHYDI